LPTKHNKIFDCKRNGIRVDVEHECLLDHNGIKYPCLMKNISISGALVSALDFPPDTLKVGDTCGLLLSTDLSLTPGEYTSRVARLGPSNIGLHFLGLDF
jgi:hypothetical protein